MNFKKERLGVGTIFKAMTMEAKHQAIRDIRSLLENRGKSVSRDYIEQVLLGTRPHKCSEEVARVVSGYFRGVIGIDLPPEDVQTDPANVVAGTPA